ncbi:hypothetical protein [uncultured Thioclava sp.]|uniref:hypothetical protein n=1 Tax=uncultured Thioclava sp. TaxID=473858 RepID=UPI0025D62B71|nr:hypothetical protein [uncultured Thioclava sp.]
MTWGQDYAAAIDPEAQLVTTKGGEVVASAFRVVATGLKLDCDAVEFDYQNRLALPFLGVISPLEELWMSWLMQQVALKSP